jgi:hypothetical protein
MDEDLVNVLLRKYVKENFTICFFCKKAIRVATDGSVDCTEFGKVSTALTCQRYEASERIKKLREGGYTKVLENLFSAKNE